MHVLVISTPIFSLPVSGYAGLEVIADHCARGLAAKGHQVAVVAPDGSACPGCEVIGVGLERQTNERTAFLRYRARLPEFDCVIDHSWQKHAYIAKAKGEFKGPVLGVMHAPVNTMYQTLPPVERPSMVCISQDQADHFEALHGRKARVCYNGIDLDTYRPLGIPRSDRFLFLARFSSIKGADLAIKACREVGVSLDLVGDTSITGEPDYLKQCLSLADGKRIKVHGGCSRGETVWWYSQAFAMLHPNQRFREPFGLAPVEALACDCPVIAWNFGAMRETIPHGEAAFMDDMPERTLVGSFEELVESVQHYKGLGFRSEQRNNLSKWAAKFSIQRMVDRYEELCLEAVRTGGW